MKNKNEIHIKLDQTKTWTRWALEAASWIICLGLIAASVSVAGLAGIVWLISGSTTLLAIGIFSGLLLGLAGIWHILLRMEKTSNLLKSEATPTG